MFTVSNRLRGTWGFMTYPIGLLIAIIFYMFTSDIYTSIALLPAYVAGESMGWGKWIGGIYSNNHGHPTPEQINDKEGIRNGVHFIANTISPEISNYYRYCIVALALRGMLWGMIALLPLIVMGYVGVNDYYIVSALLGAGFPISVIIGIRSAK